MILGCEGIVIKFPTRETQHVEKIVPTRVRAAPSLAALGSAQLDASGPSPASPGPAQAVLPLGCPFKSLQGVVDGLFQLDTASPPVLGWGGRLRPLTHAAFAAIVMYHGELAYPEPDP